jgi:hypothetical protein
MIGRNDPCVCGSGKKYKKCCEGKQQVTTEIVFQEEIENVLQTFYSTYPERKDIRGYIEIVQAWMPKLESNLQRELVEAVALDEYFFHHRLDIWTGYLKRVMKKMVRPQTIALLEKWEKPFMLIGTVEHVEETYFKAVSTLTGETFMVRRENNKPIPEGMQVFAFLLPDGSEKENHVLAVSTLIFFPAEHSKVFASFKKKFDAQSELSAESYLEKHHFDFWNELVNAGYAGEEFTTFEQDVLEQTKSFLLGNAIEPTALMTVLEDFLVEKQPKARKAAAIAAGAIRFGQDRDMFGGKSFTVKQISEDFGISASSLNKYHQELLAFVSVPV